VYTTITTYTTRTRGERSKTGSRAIQYAMRDARTRKQLQELAAARLQKQLLGVPTTVRNYDDEKLNIEYSV
jgi:hypothetical protein